MNSKRNTSLKKNFLNSGVEKIQLNKNIKYKL